MDHSPGAVVAERYRLVKILGRGGMGVVWQASDERLRRDVALKQLVLPPGLSAEHRRLLVARVEREALAAAKLKHPGIVTVHDQVTDAEGIPWIVMEYVQGRSLADAVKADGPLSPREAARIGEAVLAALEAAHARGVVHRDVKPANILLEDGRTVVTDFGIAAVEGEGHLTQTGSVLGTPSYMAPEQVGAQPVGPAADLWALGATLYYAVEGRPPFSAASPSAVFVAIVQQDPAPSAHAGPLGPVLDALLRKDPAARPTAAETTAMLARVGSAPDTVPVPETVVASPAVPDPLTPAPVASVPITPMPITPMPASGRQTTTVSGPPAPPATVGPGPEHRTPRPDGTTAKKRSGKGKPIAAAVAVAAVAAAAFLLTQGGDPETGGGGSGTPSPDPTLASVPSAFVGTWEEESDSFSLRLDIDNGSVGSHIAQLKVERGQNRCETLGSLAWATTDKIVIRMDDVCEGDDRVSLTLLGDGRARYTAGSADVTLGQED
ncbi:hypothetical protein GCM10022221_03240 [Actinocorallia aurea]